MKKRFFWFVTNLHICSDCDGNTFEISAKKSIVGSPNCMYVSKWKIRTKWLAFQSFKFKIFSRLWAEKIRQCYENLILRVQMNLWRKRFQLELVWFPKKISDFEEDFSGLDWNISAWLEILHSMRSKKQLNRKFFETIFVPQWLPGFEWNPI